MSEPQIKGPEVKKELTEGERLGFKPLPTDTGDTVLKTTPKDRLDIRQTIGGQPKAIKKVVEKYQPSFIPGVMDKVERKVFIDQRQVTPYIDVRTVLNPTDNDELKKEIMGFKGYKSESPNALEQGFIPFTSKDYDSRIAELNKGQATHLVDTSNKAQPIPFEIGLAQYLKAPKDYDPVTVFGIPIFQKIQELTGFPLDEVGGKLVYINRLNQKLIKLGVSPRSRYGIIKYRMGTEPGFFDSKVLEPAFNDYANMRGYIRNGVRSVIEAPLFIAGEVFDAINQEYDKTNLLPIGEGFEIDDPIKETLIESSEGRDELLEDFLPQQASIIQDHFAKKGIVINLATAQALASDFSNFPTRAAAVTGEVLIPGSYFAKIEKLYGKAEIANFRHFAIKTKKNPIYKNRSNDEILQMFQEMRNKQFLNSDLISPMFEIPLIGAIGRKINGFINGGRFSAGMDIRQATMANRGRNPAILENYTLIEQKKQDLIEFERKIGIGPFGSPPLSLADSKKLNELKDDLQKSIFDHRELVLREQTPKFIRDIAGQNKYIIVGSAAAGQLGENINTDPKISEMIGMVGGVIYGQTRTFRATMNWFRTNIAFGDDRRKERKTFDLAEQMARNLNTFDPQFREIVLSRIRYFANLQDSLISAGVDESVVKRSFSRITGLTILQTLEEAERLNINTKDLRSFGNLQNLQNVADEKVKLINELRAASVNISNLPDDVKNSGAVNQFYELINGAIELGTGRLNKLNADINTVEKYLPLRINAMIKGNNNVYLAANGDEVMELDSALQSVYEVGIDKVDLQGLANHVKKIKDTSNVISSAVTTAVKKIDGEYNLQDALTQIKKVATRVDDRVKIVGKQKGIPTFSKSGNLFAVLLENSKNRSYNIARQPYKVLDKTEFVDRMGNVIGRGVKTTANDLIKDLFKNMDVIDLQDFAGTGIGQSKRNKLVKAMENIGDATFQKIQAGTGANSIDEVVNDLFLKAKNDGYDFTKGLSKKMQVLQYISDTARVSTIDLNFDQLNELKHSVNRMFIRAKNSGDAPQMAAYSQLMSNVKGKFGDFRTEDGTNIGNLFINDGSRRVKVSTFLQEADQGYSDHMTRYYENEYVGKWLGLGIKGGRKNVKPNQDFPVGVAYKNDPLTWIDLDEIASFDPATKGDVFNKKMNQGFGTFNEKLGVHRIDISTEDGMAFKKAMELKSAEWLIGKYKEGKMTYNELQDQITNIHANIKGVDANGKEVSLVDLNEIIDNKLGYAPSNIKKELFTEGEALADRFIERKIVELKGEAKGIIDAKNSAIQALKVYSADKMDSGNLLKALLGGGKLRIENVKKAMRNSGVPENKVNEALENVLLSQLDNQVFEKTGRMTLLGGKGDKLVPEYDMNVQEIKDIIGFNDNVRADAIKEIIGETKYKFYQDMIEFLENESIRTLKNANFTGVPKNLSIESYISRFYSINRGVVSARYVGTEALLQQYRLRNHSMFKELLMNEEAGQLFLKMVKSGKKLDLNDEKKFFNLMGVGLVKAINVNEEQASKVSIDLGNTHNFTFTEYDLIDRPEIISSQEGYLDPFKKKFEDRRFLFDTQGKQILEGGPTTRRQ